LTGDTLVIVQKKGIKNIFVSLSHIKTMAIAFVILEG
jgi:phosphopantetheinyl transferase (holo-ACP synthase)